MDDWMDLPLSASQLGASLCSANNPEQDVYTLEVGLLGEGAGGRVLPCVAKYSFSPSPMIVIIYATKYHCWPITKHLLSSLIIVPDNFHRSRFIPLHHE